MVKINISILLILFVAIIVYAFAGITGFIIAIIVGAIVDYVGNYNHGSIEISLKGKRKK